MFLETVRYVQNRTSYWRPYSFFSLSTVKKALNMKSMLMLHLVMIEIMLGITLYFELSHFCNSGPGWRSWYSDSLRAGRSGDRIPVGVRFSAHVQTGPGSYPASCTMGTRSFPGVKRPGRGVDHPPPSGAEVKERVELYLYFSSGPSWPVLGWILPFLQQKVCSLKDGFKAVCFLRLLSSKWCPKEDLILWIWLQWKYYYMAC